jgi:hypothetical protein
MFFSHIGRSQTASDAALNTNSRRGAPLAPYPSLTVDTNHFWVIPRISRVYLLRNPLHRLPWCMHTLLCPLCFRPAANPNLRLLFISSHGSFSSSAGNHSLILLQGHTHRKENCSYQVGGPEGASQSKRTGGCKSTCCCFERLCAISFIKLE